MIMTVILNENGFNEVYKMVEINVSNFITVGLMGLLFIMIIKFASKKAGANIGL